MNEELQGKEREHIYNLILAAIINAPTTNEAKRWVASTLMPGRIDLTQPGICSFSTVGEYLTALSVTDQIVRGLSPWDDSEHEVDHYKTAKELSCNDTKLCLVFGADNLKYNKQTKYMSWDQLWCKTVTAIFRPQGLSDDEWHQKLSKIYEAPETPSRGDRAVLKFLKRR